MPVFPITLILVAMLNWTQNPRTQSPRTQNPQRRVVAPPSAPPSFEASNNGPTNAPTSLFGAEYRIGHDDLIEITVFEVPELTSMARVTASGNVSLPLVGTLEASGKTAQELEKTIEEVLKKDLVNDPHVTVFVREYASQPVSIMGAVRGPGIYQIKGQKTLLDMLATAGGIDMASAGREIQIIRRSGDRNEPARSIAVDIEDLTQNGKTELNIPIEAGDVINVRLAGSIFVIGEVNRSGEFPLRNGRNVTVTQAMAMGGGFTKEAKKKECVIIRVDKDGSKQEIPVNIEKVLDGSINDVTMMPEDILFVPASRMKTGVMRGLEAAIGVVTGRLIYWR